MRLKRIIVMVLFVAVLAFLWTQAYLMHREASQLEEKITALSQKSEQLTKENADIEQDVTYYSDPQNVDKLLRSRFNYKKPGEHMIIVIPQ